MHFLNNTIFFSTHTNITLFTPCTKPKKLAYGFQYAKPKLNSSWPTILSMNHLNVQFCREYIFH